MMETPISNQKEIICSNCGADLVYQPGTHQLTCQFCGNVNEIKSSTSDVVEINYNYFISHKQEDSVNQTIKTITCQGCGATTTLEDHKVADSCGFCNTPLVIDQQKTEQLIRPQGILPFHIDEKNGVELYRKWIKKLWWAPNSLKKMARQEEKLQGIYIPYWTYDSSTTTNYTGQRGDDYETTQTFTNSEGKQETRTVTNTDWTKVSGTVYNNFDDVMVVASRSLSEKYVDMLEPWDLNKTVNYDSKYISGFKAEKYQRNVEEGFERAKQKMDYVIEGLIRNQIGGDHQRIHSKSTQYNKVTFKHLLLPIWISSYRYKDEIYRFMINGRTGEVQGERPYSWIKITLAVVAALATGAGIYYFTQ